MPEDGNDSVAGRIASVRKRLQRRRKAKAAEARAEARSEKRGPKARERAERERRIERNNPDTATESAAAAGKEVKLIASELGVTPGRAKGLIERGTEALESGRDFDRDGDGDSDILEAIEDGVEGRAGQRGDDFEPPVGGVEDDIEDLDGIEEELGLDEPIEDQQDGGLF